MRRFAHVRPGRRSQGQPAHRCEAGGVLAKLVWVVVVVVLAGGGVAFLRSRSDAPMSGQVPDLPPAAPQQPTAPTSGLRLQGLPTSPPVLAGIGTSKPVSGRRLKQLIIPQLGSDRLGRHLGFAVAALGSRRLLMRTGGPHAVTPASTMKLLTTATALSVLGPQHRFATEVVKGNGVRQIVLVGGGDPLLTDDNLTTAEHAAAYPRPATLQQLAARTAHGLAQSGLGRVSLGYDDSLFSGPAVNSRWESSYVPQSVVSPISPLWVDEGRSESGLLARVSDPARVAAARFATLLAQQGVEVRAGLAHVRAPPHAARVASVESAPLAQIVQHTLEHSDNEAAEVLLRQLAIGAGRPGSSAAGVAVVTKTLAGLGVDLSGAGLYDGSGLSRQDRLPIDALIQVLQAAAAPRHPELRAVVSDLPVAGFSGSLEYRFVDDAPAGLGFVRAKTGTLTGVHALAGLVSTRGGQILVFAAVADRVLVIKTLSARAQLDRIATVLSTCGC